VKGSLPTISAELLKNIDSPDDMLEIVLTPDWFTRYLCHFRLPNPVMMMRRRMTENI